MAEISPGLIQWSQMASWIRAGKSHDEEAGVVKRTGRWVIMGLREGSMLFAEGVLPPIQEGDGGDGGRRPPEGLRNGGPRGRVASAQVPTSVAGFTDGRKNLDTKNFIVAHICIFKYAIQITAVFIVV